MARAITTNDEEIGFELGRTFHGIGFITLELSLFDLEQSIEKIGIKKTFAYLRNDLFTRMIAPNKVILTDGLMSQGNGGT